MAAADTANAGSGKADLDWQTFPRWLATEAVSRAPAFAEVPLEFAGAHVYVGLDAGDAAGVAGLKEFLRNYTDAPNDRIVLREIPPTRGECHICHLAGTPGCHQCRNLAIEGSAGVAAAMGTDLIRLVRDDPFDVLLLVSSEVSLIPVVRFLEKKGKKVVHGAFPPRVRDLSAACSAVIDLGSLLGASVLAEL